MNRDRRNTISLLNPGWSAQPLEFDGNPLTVRELADRLSVAAFLRDRHMLGRGIEIGVREGDHAQHLWDIAAPAELHLADLWQHAAEQHRDEWTQHGERVRKRFRQQIADGRVVLHAGDHRQTLQQLEPASFDWCYFDTFHRYRPTRDALADCIRLCKVGGTIGLHDFRQHADWQTGAMRPVFEALNTDAFRVLAISNTDWPDLLIEKRHDIEFAGLTTS